MWIHIIFFLRNPEKKKRSKEWHLFQIDQMFLLPLKLKTCFGIFSNHVKGHDHNCLLHKLVEFIVWIGLDTL